MASNFILVGRVVRALLSTADLSKETTTTMLRAVMARLTREPSFHLRIDRSVRRAIKLEIKSQVLAGRRSSSWDNSPAADVASESFVAPESPAEWSCESCTFLNDAFALACLVCLNPRCEPPASVSSSSSSSSTQSSRRIAPIKTPASTKKRKHGARSPGRSSSSSSSSSDRSSSARSVNQRSVAFADDDARGFGQPVMKRRRPTAVWSAEGSAAVGGPRPSRRPRVPGTGRRKSPSHSDGVDAEVAQLGGGFFAEGASWSTGV